MVTALSKTVFPRFGDAAIASPYGIRQIGTQQYLPIQGKRSLSDGDESQIKRGLRQWWPTVFQSYATPMHKMLASPVKSGLLGGWLAGGAAALYLAFSRASTPTLAFISGGVALLVAILTYFSRQQQNENVLDLMQRLPEGATKRDMLSDPVYQKDLDRHAMRAGGGSFGGDIGTVLIAQSLMGGGGFRSGGGYRSSYPGGMGGRR